MAHLRHSNAVRGFFVRVGQRYTPRRPPKSEGSIAIPDHMLKNYGVWRIVMARRATYEEIRRFWDLNEVMHANELLDIQDDAEWLASRPKK